MDGSTNTTYPAQASSGYAPSATYPQDQTASNIRPVNGVRTAGLHNDPHTSHPADTPLSERKVETVKPKGYMAAFYDSLNTGTQVLRDFSKDFMETTVKTFQSAWSSKSQAIPELAKFGSGIAVLGGSLVQTAAAGAAEVMESAGFQVSDQSVDGLSFLLKKAGVTTSGLTKSEMRHLSTSLAGLSVGMAQDIDLPNGQFHMTQADGSQLTIKEVHLQNMKPSHRYTEESERETLSISADKLSFSVEYKPPEGDTTKLNIAIPAPQFTGETNLMSILGNVAGIYCDSLMQTLEATSDREEPTIRDDSEALYAPVSQEDSHLDFKADGAIIRVESPGTLLKDYTTPTDSVVNLQDIHVQQNRSMMANKSPEAPVFKVGLIEVDNVMAGPLKAQSGFLRLDDSLNGEVVITLMADYHAFKAFCPSWIPDSIQKSVTGTDANKQHAMVRLGIEIKDGNIDLNSLKASGMQKKGLTETQIMIEKFLILMLQSEHTRLRHQEAGSELKIHVPFIKSSSKKKNLLRRQKNRSIRIKSLTF